MNPTAVPAAADRVHGVDRIRAFAALSVMLAHIVGGHLPGLLQYVFTGYPAVFAFFVISGFCIHRPYVERPLPAVAFLSARVIRIMVPVVVAMYLAGIAGVAHYNLKDGYILWSIVCELWYYGLYPFLYLLSRWVPWRVQWLIAFAASYALALRLGADPYGNIHYLYGPYKTWIFGLPAWILGCVLAESYANRPSRLPIYTWRILVAAAAAMIYWASVNGVIRFHLTLNPFAVLVFFWMRAEINAAKGPNWLDWVGTWSFAIYLVHVVAEAFLKPFIDNIGLLFGASLVSCYLFYLAVESPSHAAARRVFKFVMRRPRVALSIASAPAGTLQAGARQPIQ